MCKQAIWVFKNERENRRRAIHNMPTMCLYLYLKEREVFMDTQKKKLKFLIYACMRGADVMFCHDMINWAFNGLMMDAQLIEERLQSPKFHCFPWMWVKLPRTTLFSDSQLDKRSSLLSLVSKKVLRNCPWVKKKYIYIYLKWVCTASNVPNMYS